MAIFKNIEFKGLAIEKAYCKIWKFEGNNPIAQSYEYLKILEEFKDAEDC